MDWTGALHVIWISYAFSNTMEPHYYESMKCGLLMDILLRFCFPIDSQHNVEETTPLKGTWVDIPAVFLPTGPLLHSAAKSNCSPNYFVVMGNFTGSARISKKN